MKCSKLQEMLADIKVIGLLLALQMEYMKCCCFLCLWEVEQPEYYVVKDWSAREDFGPRCGLHYR